MKKETRKPKSKMQLLSEIKKTADFKKKMKFTKEVFFPALCEASENISEAQMWLSGFNTALMQKFLGQMKEVKMKDLKLDEELPVDAPKYKEIVKLFDEFSLFDAKDQIEGLNGEISLFIRDENETRKLDSLPTKWADEV